MDTRPFRATGKALERPHRDPSFCLLAFVFPLVDYSKALSTNEPLQLLGQAYQAREPFGAGITDELDQTARLTKPGSMREIVDNRAPTRVRAARGQSMKLVSPHRRASCSARQSANSPRIAHRRALGKESLPTPSRGNPGGSAPRLDFCLMRAICRGSFGR